MSNDDLRDLFLLRDGLVFLNHGSFGACPRPVHERYQALQRELEANPMAFLGEDREFPGRMAAARLALASFVGARHTDLVFVPNATYALNVVARSVALRPGDEVLITDHAYGAVERLWRCVCERRGARLVQARVALPVESAPQVADEIWRQVTERTRVLCLDHITSPTALTMPLADLLSRARRAGILSVVDGAHAPGHLPLDLTELGADVYAGNCHKWLCAPKGAGFLWARPDVQPSLEPLVVSWGWPGTFVAEQEWTGTRDPAAWLAVPDAIAFQRAHDWPREQRRCRALVRQARDEVSRLTGMVPICPDDGLWFAQMHTLPLPPGTDPAVLQRGLREHEHIEIPVFIWNERPYLRVSIQAYNTAQDVEALVQALKRHAVA